MKATTIILSLLVFITLTANMLWPILLAILTGSWQWYLALILTIPIGLVCFHLFTRFKP